MVRLKVKEIAKEKGITSAKLSRMADVKDMKPITTYIKSLHNVQCFYHVLDLPGQVLYLYGFWLCIFCYFYRPWQGGHNQAKTIRVMLQALTRCIYLLF